MRVSMLNSVRGMQAVDGPNSSQLEWHQDGWRTNWVSTKSTQAQGAGNNGFRTCFGCSRLWAHLRCVANVDTVVVQRRH
jgi:hypothetical protein